MQHWKSSYCLQTADWNKSNISQNKKFDGGKCEDNVSGKTRVLIESAQKEKNVCKTF
jgi:hypothetical protein